jgi:hypothetical protein
MVFDARSSFVLARFELGHKSNADSSYDRLYRCGFIATTFPCSNIALTTAFRQSPNIFHLRSLLFYSHN